MRHLPRRRHLLALAAALAAAGLVGGVAYGTGALGSSGSDIVTVCVSKDGTARFVDTATDCRKTEHAVLLAAAVESLPNWFSVDCDAGQKIGDVLDQIPGTMPVTIEVSGTCNESVRISRDNVDLQAASGGATIHDSGFAVIVDGARGVNLDGLTLTSDGSALAAWSGALFTATGLDVSGKVEVMGEASGRFTDSTLANGSFVGLWVRNGSVDFSGGSITSSGGSGVGCDAGYVRLGNVTVSGNSGNGVDANGTCEVAIWGGAVQDNDNGGVAAWGGGDITVNGTTIQRNQMHAGALAQSGGTLNIGDSSIVDNGFFGVSAYAGGHVVVSGSTIEGNVADGVNLTGGSSLGLDHSTIRANGGNGLALMDTSVATVSNGENTITGNGGWGIWCQPAPAVAMLAGWQPANPGTVSGNTAGQISCPGF